MEGKNDTKRITRNFGLSSLSVNNKSTVYVLTFIITIMGLISYNSMPKESFPEIVFFQKIIKMKSFGIWGKFWCCKKVVKGPV